jgi:hypothetical protein
MSNPIIPKRNANQASTTPPAPGDLTTGEIASNLTSGSLYLKMYDGSVVDVGPVKSVNSSTGHVVISPAGIGAISTTQLGVANGVATLGADAKLTSSQLPEINTTNIAALTTSAIAGLIPQLDGTGHISLDQIPPAIIGALNYQGLWDADTNTPALTSSVGTKGYYYVVSVHGHTNLNGHDEWLVGDLVVFDGSAWDKVPGNDSQVISVNGVSPIHGNVTLVPSDIGAVSTTELGALNGVATLDGAGHLYTSQLAAATTSQIGGIIVGNNLTITPDGVLSGVNSYSLPPATTSTLGGIIAGEGTAVQLDGTLSVPVATYTDAGRVKPGIGLKFIGTDGEIVPDENYTITVSTPPTVFNGGTY